MGFLRQIFKDLERGTYDPFRKNLKTILTAGLHTGILRIKEPVDSVKHQFSFSFTGHPVSYEPVDSVKHQFSFSFTGHPASYEPGGIRTLDLVLRRHSRYLSHNHYG